jgi:hypothetical protein
MQEEVQAAAVETVVMVAVNAVTAVGVLEFGLR